MTYTLFKGNDSITSATTDVDGQFTFEIELEFNSDYVLSPINNPDGLGKDDLEFQTIYSPMEYIFEFQNLAVRREYGGQVAYYRANNTKNVEEFEVEQILSIIEVHPEICIQFSQTIIRSESKKTAKKRKANFMKFLEENGVDMSCIQFDKETRVLKAFDEDQRSRIQGAIASMESKCE